MNFSDKSRDKFVIRDCILPVHIREEQDISSLSSRGTEKVIIDSGPGKNVSSSPVDNGTQTPLLKLKNCAIRRRRIFLSPTEEGHSHMSDPSFGEESHLGSGKMSVRIQPLCKFKRLRKAEDSDSNVNQKNNNPCTSTANLLKSSSSSNPTRYKHGQGDFRLFGASFVLFT